MGYLGLKMVKRRTLLGFSSWLWEKEECGFFWRAIVEGTYAYPGGREIFELVE
jgi:hypothetical protein